MIAETMKITIIGNGNVATHLGKAFSGSGHSILQIFGRNRARAQELATVLEAEAVDDLGKLDTTADLYLLAVSDEAIAPLAERLPGGVKGLVVHCSGATEMSVLGRFPSHGVLYPVQSITKSADLAIAAVPFATEGNTAQTTASLLGLAQQLSAKSFVCDGRQRLALHVAAVFANNFANAMFGIAHEIMEENGLSFDLLRPIILETAQKVQTHAPKGAQTGPAKRSDEKTIQKHLDFIGKNPGRTEIYRMVTETIRNGER